MGAEMAGHQVVSVFCGCGGLDLGFVEAGFEMVYACDNDFGREKNLKKGKEQARRKIMELLQDTGLFGFEEPEPEKPNN